MERMFSSNLISPSRLTRHPLQLLFEMCICAHSWLFFLVKGMDDDREEGEREKV
jgi:hypothetical protein